MELSFNWENRVPIGLAVLLSVIALVATLILAPATISGPVQLTATQEQVITGSGGRFWVAIGVAGLIVGACILAPTLPAIFAGTATVAIVLQALGGAGAIAGGFGSIASGASQLMKR